MTDTPEPPTPGHRLEFWVFRLVEIAAGAMSMEACAVFGGILGTLFRFVSPRYRRLVRRNLRIATASDPLPPRQLDRLIRETFRRAGANFLCSLHSATIPAPLLRPYFELHGTDMLRRQPDQPGLLVTLAHQGNWEVLVRLPGLMDGLDAFGAVYRPLNNPLMDELSNRRRTADGARLFSRKDGFHAPIALLRSPGVLGVLADQRAGGRGEVLPFFGKLSSCSPLPDLMCRRARAEVATASITSIADGAWRIEFETIGRPEQPAAIMAALEAAMRRSLPDVFWFHDRWRTDSRRPLSFFAPIDPENARRATVPLRVLLTTPSGNGTVGALIETMLERRPDLRIDWLTAEPPEHSPDPRVAVHAWDLTLPDERADGILAGIDEAHPAPLDAALLFGGTKALAMATRRLGVRSIIGLGNPKLGKPWTHCFEPPDDADGWRRMVVALARVPKQDP